MLKKIIIPSIAIVLVFSCFKKSEGLKPVDVPGLVNQFLAMHAQYHQVDDKISEKIFNNYINILDYGKYYFYKEDVARLSKHKFMIDDYLALKKFEVVTIIFGVYKKRFSENMDLFVLLIEYKYDFNKDEKIIVDREKIKYANDKNEMKERWRKSIKLQLLNYMSLGKKLPESREKLKKKYKLLRRRVNEIDQEKIYANFMNAFSTALDPHSNYLTQDQHEDFKISMELKLEGIGVRLRSEDGFIIVESIIVGGATDKLPENIRLKPNDKIVAVAQAAGEAIDVIDMDLRDVVKKIRGKKGTEVRLTILREAGTGNGDKPSRLIVPIVREEIKLQDSDAESDILTLNVKGKKEKIGYIKLPSFYQDRVNMKSSARDMKVHTNKLIKKGVTGIILDLRGNPGGLLNEAIDIAGLFIGSGPVVQIKDGRNPAQVYPNVIVDNDNDLFYDGPVVILIDRFSASASEILAGAIKDYKRGLVIGPGNTYGKGTVQSYNVLPFEKGAIKVTTHIFYQPGGTSNQLNGIIPNLLIPSISSIWDVGENKTRYPLKWKKIQSAYFKPYKYVSPRIVANLKSMSSRRIKKSDKFKKLVVKIEKLKKQMSNKSISLKDESKIEKEKKEEIEKTFKKDRGKKVINLENDLFLKEAFNITSDYIKIMRKIKR
ncbi:MAG: hypothetical protein GY754_25365 [bacterium]|nr:hypothetical protein [bacterium]